MSRPYNKPFQTIDQQIDLLKSRGLIIKHDALAFDLLSTLNYYRLSAYFYTFQSDRINHIFQEGVCIEDVKNLYDFDHVLRQLFLEAISYIEIAMRTSWAYYVSQNYGPHGFLGGGFVKSQKHLTENLHELQQIIDKSSESFVSHYKNNYTEPDVPPAWAVCELMSFGQLSRWYSNMKPACRAKKAIAHKYKFHEEEFEGVLEHLTYIRNICAHHGRLWNKSLAIKRLPDLKTKPAGLRAMMQKDDDKSSHLYNSIVLISHFLDVIPTSASDWRARLVDCIDRFKPDLESMGFVEGWREMRVFRLTS